MRVTSSLWAAAFVRRCHLAGAFAVVQRRGAAEAGAIFVVLDCLDGAQTLFGPAPQSMLDETADERRFSAILAAERDPQAMSARLAREIAFDPDLWILAVEDRGGRHFLELVV